MIEKYLTGASRSDRTGRGRYDLIWWPLIDALAHVLEYGASRMGERNWEAGLPTSRCFDSLIRHVLQWRAGEDRDQESGLLHLAHAAFNLMALIRFSGTEHDDLRMEV